MKKTLVLAAGYVTLAMTLFSVGCKKDDNNDAPSYTVPTTYYFTNVDSSNAKTYLSMLAEMENLINTGNTANTVVSAAKLKGMFTNTGNYFTDTTFSGVKYNLNTSGLQLAGNTIPAAAVVVNAALDSIGAASSTGKPAANGQAGVSDKKTLLSANGIYWRQFFTKLMMGAFIGHQIADVYLKDSLNSSISLEAKQHAWDQAFFLWNVPVNFPANRAGVKYWGSYTSQIDSGIAKPVVNLTGINSNTTLMNAFLKGRAALANNDLNTAKAQAAIIIPFFEIMEAAATVHETNEAKGNLPNGAAAVCGNMSEALGFWTGLKFNNTKKISDADYGAVLTLFGTNFYSLTPAGITAIQDKISSIYGWDAVKTNL
ncbi:hypothetical protein A4H97_11695 [Niastella yeongjuensis]|uniref:DUF4856 domain-containing protein n=1 Tax=Niastella yeongjuensis TaxID=354355 RepID=A0A1V9E9L2_9BACT|nr:DUF4856 domain-containing protein [Niastella yeongjuensis]OQP42817.1 hypothetical protein A4H97_11695 [Niastella yeongjuensis]SEO55330.1 protein of unknown function [Niastella yeongjuensis]